MEGSTFSKNLIHLLNERGITRKELAEKLSISSSTVDYWIDKGIVPRAVTLRGIASVLDTELYTLTDNVSNFACNLDYLLKRHSMTPNDLAAIVGLKKDTIIYWLSGDRLPCITALGILSEIFRVDRVQLLDGNLIGEPISSQCRNFSNNMRNILYSIHLGYTDFAKLIGVTHRIVDLWINKQLCPTDITMCNIVNILGITYDELLSVTVENFKLKL